MNLAQVKMSLKPVLLILGFCLFFGRLEATVNICSGIPDNMFLPYYGDCSMYYVCISGNPISRSCDGDSEFDAKTQSCVAAGTASCMPECPQSALTSFCYDRTCTKYILCYAGTPVIRECCDGLQYNAETDRCDFPQYVDCVDNLCTIFNDVDNITYLASKASCEKYYVCVSGQPFNQSCSSGLQFNPECNCCDFPSRANCTVTAIKRNINSFSKAPPKKADIDCPKEGISFIPHRSPEKYYYCLNGRGVILDCTPGLHYDPELETCREPAHIGLKRLSNYNY